MGSVVVEINAQSDMDRWMGVSGNYFDDLYSLKHVTLFAELVVKFSDVLSSLKNSLKTISWSSMVADHDRYFIGVLYGPQES